MRTSRREPPDEAHGSAPPTAHPSPRARRHREPLPWGYFLTFLVGALLVVSAMWYHVDDERRGILAHWSARVSSTADDRVRLVELWISARRADAEVLAASPAVRASLERPRDGAGALARYLDQVAASSGYASIRVFDGGGQLSAQSTGAGPPGPATRHAAEVALARHVDIDLIEEAGRRLFSLSVPVVSGGGTARAGDGRVLGAVTLQMAPDASLFPLLGDERASTKTGETLLYRLDGGHAAYLSPLRHEPRSDAAIARSLAAIGGSAVDPVEEIADYRGIPVLAAARRITPSGWGLLFKIDRDEALAQLGHVRQLAGAAAAFLLLALAGLIISLWRQRERTKLLQAQMAQERAILALEGYAEIIVSSVPSGLLLLGGDLRVLSVNAALLQTLGVARSDVVGRELGEVVRSEGLLPRAREVLRTGQAQRDVLFALAAEGNRADCPALITLVGIPTGDGAARLLLIVRDLSEEERLDAARRQSEQRFRDLVQTLDAIVWEADASSLCFSFASERAESLLGWPVQRWLGEPDFFAARIHPADRDRAMQTCREAIARGADHEIEYRAPTADGRLLWLRDIVHVLRDPANGGLQLRGLTVDLTLAKQAEAALHQAEAELRQAQKMDALGKLAGGIAHDFNNLLMVIRGDGDLILRRLPEGHPLRPSAEGIRDAADQAATFTKKLLAVSRKQVLAPVVLDVNRVVRGLSQMLERLMGETIEIAIETVDDVGAVTADPGQLEQVLLNLAVNARDAMPDGGRVTIRTANAEIDEALASRRGVGPGAYVVLEVSDAGIGMDAETKTHLFEPFFTTKEQGKGTGLGLSTVYGIVKQSGGHIEVESEPGQGATLRIFLPRVDAPPSPTRDRGPHVGADEAMARAALGRAREAPRRETILLVEDAERVRAVVGNILDMHGYHVIAARHGAEAIALSSGHPGPIHLMLTDVVMPAMSGPELAQRLAPLRPDMKVLYMSGYSDVPLVRHDVLDSGLAFLAKPFTPDALAASVREILDESGWARAETTRA